MPLKMLDARGGDGAGPPPAGVVPARVTTWRQGRVDVARDWLIDEVPVALVFNGISYAVMLASPTDLEDFARGFALSEGLLANASELYGIDVTPVDEASTAHGIEVRLEVAAACEFRLKERRRNLGGRTGCGLCGTESLDQVLRPIARGRRVARRSTATPSRVALRTMARRAAAAEDLRRVARGGVVPAERHASSLAREDVGRHNALDKLIGAMVAAGTDADAGLRRHHEPRERRDGPEGRDDRHRPRSSPCRRRPRSPSASPTETGVALAGFARGSDFVCYTEPERFGVFESKRMAAS